MNHPYDVISEIAGCRADDPDVQTLVRLFSARQAFVTIGADGETKISQVSCEGCRYVFEAVVVGDIQRYDCDTASGSEFKDADGPYIRWDDVCACLKSAPWNESSTTASGGA